MRVLHEPMELIDLQHGESITLRVDAYEDGSAKIYPHLPTARHVAQHMAENALAVAPPAGHPIGVTIPVLRLYGQRLDQPSSSPYWDVSSKTLAADLATRLDVAAGMIPGSTLILRNEGNPRPRINLVASRTFRLTANGKAPHKRYSVEEG